MPSTRTFLPLDSTLGIAITQCGELLDNHMQCLRKGEYEMTLTASDGTVLDQHQVCLRHKLVIQSQDNALIVLNMIKEEEQLNKEQGD